ncbi:MAG: hypothetical protein KDA71_07640, partial [Planctomycetales bacterium]|nr:hypothetical protein [Planctomycetales bacterium]
MKSSLFSRLTLAALGLVPLCAGLAAAADDGSQYHIADIAFLQPNNGSTSPSDVAPATAQDEVPSPEQAMTMEPGADDSEASEECEDDDGPIRLFHETCSGIQVGGWISAGTYYNTNGNTASNANNPIAFQDVFGPSLDQAWIYAEKALDTECGCDWGFRVDY